MKIRSCRSPPASFAATVLKASRASRGRTPEGGALFDEEVPYRNCAEADYRSIRLKLENKKGQAHNYQSGKEEADGENHQAQHPPYRTLAY